MKRICAGLTLMLLAGCVLSPASAYANNRVLHIALDATITEPQMGAVGLLARDLLSDELTTETWKRKTTCVARAKLGADLTYTKVPGDAIQVSGAIVFYEGRRCRDTERARQMVDVRVEPDGQVNFPIDIAAPGDDRATGVLVLRNERPSCTGRHVRFQAHMFIEDEDVISKSEFGDFESEQVSLFVEPGDIAGIKFERCVDGEVVGQLLTKISEVTADSVVFDEILVLLEGDSCNTDDEDDTRRRRYVVASGDSITREIRAEDFGDQVIATVHLENHGQACWAEVTSAPFVISSPYLVLENICGDGIVQRREQCDEGRAVNGTPSSCCTQMCRFRTAGEVCRASAGACDIEDVCSGQSSACPDRIQPQGHVCRGLATVCDVADTCSGQNTACPDAHAPDMTLCDDDGDRCNGDATCQNGTCVQGMALDCRSVDNDACTYNRCDPRLGCQVPAVSIPGCDPSQAREVIVGGAANLCLGGSGDANNVCVVTAGNVSLSIPPNTLTTPTAITVAPLTLQGCAPCSGPGVWSLQDPLARVASCTKLMPEGLTLNPPATLSLGWTTSGDCNSRFSCPNQNTIREGRILVYRDNQAAVEQCSTQTCPDSPTSHSCLIPANCCATSGCATDDVVCDPGANRWIFRNLRQF